jgi:hypothetical protein
MKIRLSRLKKLIKEEVKNLSEAEKYTKPADKLNPSDEPAPSLKPGDVIASDDEGELIFVG